MNQLILRAENNYADVDEFFEVNHIKKILLVCGASVRLLNIGRYFDELELRKGIKVVKFSDFKPNPVYESVVEGVQVFREQECDAIFAVGGGSAMDVAKCIKLYSNMKPEQNYLQQKIVPNDVKLLAAPTTAGTGSEATRYAVIYYNGEKQSVTDDSCIPSAVLMDSSCLKTLPIYQKKVTMLDALCHAIESFWSVHSSEESRDFSKRAITLILENKAGYLANEDESNDNMLKAANLSGKAINITQTTAGHAMSYKLTSLYGIAHGHAVALCVSKIWPYMISHTEKCSDSRGADYLRGIFDGIAEVMNCKKAQEAAQYFNDFLDSLQLESPVLKNEEELETLVASVNLERLRNNPIMLDVDTLRELYGQILDE
jgi:alcohol dehydrogenase class IV